MTLNPQKPLKVPLAFKIPFFGAFGSKSERAKACPQAPSPQNPTKPDDEASDEGFMAGVPGESNMNPGCCRPCFLEVFGTACGSKKT